jgi:hypothetical protein
VFGSPSVDGGAPTIAGSARRRQRQERVEA